MIALLRDGKTPKYTYNPKELSNLEINSVLSQHKKEGQIETHFTARKSWLRICIPASETSIIGDFNMRKKEASRKRPVNIMMRTLEAFSHVKEPTRKEIGVIGIDIHLNVGTETEKKWGEMDILQAMKNEEA